MIVQMGLDKQSSNPAWNFVSLHANDFEKGMNPSLLFPAMDK